MLERAVELGYAPAEALLADCCETGYGVEQNSLKAEQLRVEATAQGYVLPNNRKGIGSPRNCQRYTPAYKMRRRGTM